MAHYPGATAGYRFGRGHKRGVRALVRGGACRVNGYLKNLIEAIADAKLRRMERELELHGTRLGRRNKPRSGALVRIKGSGSARQF
jgi:hypothetical protein